MPDEVLAQPPDALVKSMGGRDDSYSYSMLTACLQFACCCLQLACYSLLQLAYSYSYSYLMLASGMQLSQQKVKGMVAASQAHTGGCRWVERSRLTRSPSHSG